MAKIASFSLNEESLSAIDELEEVFKFRNHSDTVRAAVKALLSELEVIPKPNEKVVAIAAIIHYESEEEELHKLKHDFNDIVASQLHNYFSGTCFEVFILNGRGERIASFARELKRNTKFKQAKLLTISEQ